MKIHGAVAAVLAIVAGILILTNWISLQWVVGIYLIVIGIIGLVRP